MQHLSDRLDKVLQRHALIAKKVLFELRYDRNP